MRKLFLILVILSACTSRQEKKTEAVNDLLELYRNHNRFERTENGKRIIAEDIFSIQNEKSFRWKRIKWILNEQAQAEKIFIDFVETDFHNLMTMGSFIEQDIDGSWIFFYSNEYQNVLPLVSIQIDLTRPAIYDKTNVEWFFDSLLDPEFSIIIPKDGFFSELALRLLLKIPDAYDISNQLIVPCEMSCKIGILNRDSSEPEEIANKMLSLFSTLISMNKTDEMKKSLNE